MEWYFQALRNYALFSGRARRKEYWWFLIINSLIVAAMGETVGPYGFHMAGVFQAVLLLPTISVNVRRMHDVGKSGWFAIIPIVNLIYALTDSEVGDNRFGRDPKATERGRYY